MGEPVVMVSDAVPIMGKRIDARALQAFEQRLVTELFVEMLPWEGCMFDIRVSASLSNDVLINIQLEGEDPAEFAFPVFCDSLVAPVIVDDRECIDNMGETLTGIIDSLGSTRRPDDSPGIITSSSGFRF